MYLGIIEDTREEKKVKHRLLDVLKLMMLAILCGMDELSKIVEYGNSKKEYLKNEFNIISIPSKPTLTRILRIIKPQVLVLCIEGILRTLVKNEENQIMIDGKAIRSTDAMNNIEKMLNIVTAYTDTGICLGQETVNEKSNEIPAARELITKLNICGKVVTLDALHCQKETAKLIIENKGDYVLQLKENQKTFYEEVLLMFEDKYGLNTNNDDEYDIYSTEEKSHGRIEKRTCYVLKNLEYFEKYTKEWKGLKRIFAVKRIVEKNGKISKETSLYLSSKCASPKELLNYTRNHWSIESMHHILDVSFSEDDCMVRDKEVHEVLNVFRKTAISLHKKYLEGKHTSIRSSMFKCLLNEDYLHELLQFCNNS